MNDFRLRILLINIAATVVVHHSTVSPDFTLSLLHAFPAFILSSCCLADLPPGVVVADVI